MRERARLPLWSSSMTNVTLMLDWLDATSTATSIRQSGHAAKKWARIVANFNCLPRSAVLGNMQMISYTCLRKARVRLDIVARLVWRAFWKTLL